MMATAGLRSLRKKGFLKYLFIHVMLCHRHTKDRPSVIVFFLVSIIIFTVHAWGPQQHEKQTEKRFQYNGRKRKKIFLCNVCHVKFPASTEDIEAEHPREPAAGALRPLELLVDVYGAGKQQNKQIANFISFTDWKAFCAELHNSGKKSSSVLLHCQRIIKNVDARLTSREKREREDGNDEKVGKSPAPSHFCLCNFRISREAKEKTKKKKNFNHQARFVLIFGIFVTESPVSAFALDTFDVLLRRALRRLSW